MARHELESADDCRQRLQEVAEVLEHLHAARRLRMSTDTSNTAWTDVDAAVRSALASLDVAVQATAWMETVPAGSPGTRA